MSSSRLFAPRSKGAFTLIELTITTFLIILMAGVITYTYLAIAQASGQQEARATARGGLMLRLQRVVQDLRLAKAVTLEGNHAIRYTVNEGSGDQNFIFYMFHASDTYPPAFTQTGYQLRKAPLTGGLNGSFTLGDGPIYLENLLVPPDSTVSLSGKEIILLYTAKVKSGPVKIQTTVRPRNLL